MAANSGRGGVGSMPLRAYIRFQSVCVRERAGIMKWCDRWNEYWLLVEHAPTTVSAWTEMRRTDEFFS